VVEDRNELIEQIKVYWKAKKEEVEKEVLEISDQLIKKINEFGQLKEKYAELKKAHVECNTLQEFKQQMHELGKSLKQDWAEWGKLYDQIMQEARLQRIKAIC